MKLAIAVASFPRLSLNPAALSSKYALCDGWMADRAAAIRRPMLLRFASDAFMQELAGILDDDPERLAEIEARPGETWRDYPGALARRFPRA